MVEESDSLYSAFNSGGIEPAAVRETSTNILIKLTHILTMSPVFKIASGSLCRGEK